MAQQTINIGTAPNDGTGTPLRTAFDYCNLNFTELYTAVGPSGNNIAVPGNATITGNLTAARLIVTGGTIPTNGLWLPTTNTLEFAANSLAQYRIAPLGVFSWFDGAGGTRMTLNSTGLGIGGTPITKFFVQDATLTAASQIREQVIRANADNVNNSLNSLIGFTFLANPSAYTAGSFSRTSGVYGINLDNAAFGRRMGLVFYTSAEDATATEKMRIDSSGNLLVGVTSANANGGVLQLKSGITFPATQVASSDANTLDDYEEGTWTPALTFATPGTLALTYNQQSGSYTKIGRLVTVIFRVSFAAAGIIKGTASGDLSITGLPFTVGSANAYQYVDLGSSITDITTGSFALITATGTSITFETVSTSGTRIQRDSAALTAASFAASNAGFITISGTFTYFV
jgi:hypothetical protein